MKLVQRKIGWIGVDVGTSSVKIVQVAHDKHGWRVAAAAVVPRQQSWQADTTAAAEAISSLDEMKAAKSLQEGYRGRSVAATLPMALCDVHRLDRELDKEANADQMLRQTIETATQQSVARVQCDYWSAPATAGKPAWTQALTVSRNWTERLCEDIAEAGWSCQAIDGLPHAIQRAVNMVHPKTSPAPVAALDWGNSRATLCLIDKGQPSYVRCLKDCGLQKLLAALVEDLQVTELEAQRLLEVYGLAAACSESASESALGSSSGRASEIAQLVQEIIAEPIRQLVEEIERSFAHYQFLRRAAAPQTVYLLGGGAMIKQLATRLSTQLKMDVRKWQLPTDDSEPSLHDPSADCLLAPAIALSAMAWEAS